MGLAPPPQSSQRGYDVDWDSGPRVGASHSTPFPCDPLSMSTRRACPSPSPSPWALVAPTRRDRGGVDLLYLEESGRWPSATPDEARAKADEKDSGHDDKDRDASVGHGLDSDPRSCSCAADDLDSDDLIRSLAAAPEPPPLPLPLSSVVLAVSTSAAISAFGSGSSCLEFEGSHEDDTSIAPAVESLSPTRWSSSFLLSARSSIAIAAPPTTPTPHPPGTCDFPPQREASPREAPPLPLIRVTSFDHDRTPARPEPKMRGPTPHRTGGNDFAMSPTHDDRTVRATHLEDSSTIATSIYPAGGSRHAASLASSRRLFTTLLPPTPFSDRPSSSQSHLAGLRGYHDHDTMSLSADDPWAEGQGRISSESAMTVLQRDSAYRGRMEGRHNSDTDTDASSGPLDVTATMTRREFEALPPAIQRKVCESALVDIAFIPSSPSDLHTAGPHTFQTKPTHSHTCFSAFLIPPGGRLTPLSPPSRPGLLVSLVAARRSFPGHPRPPSVWGPVVVRQATINHQGKNSISALGLKLFVHCSACT